MHSAFTIHGQFTATSWQIHVLLLADSKRAVFMCMHNAMALNNNTLHSRALSALTSGKKLFETDRHRLPAQACLDVPMMCMCMPLHVVLKTKILTCLVLLQQQPPVCKSPNGYACSG
jgi:hypothetical protein